MISSFFLKISKLFFNKNEKIFLEENKIQKQKFDPNKKTIIFQMPTDYFFLLYWKLIIKSHYFNKYNLIGIWHHNLRSLKKDLFLIQLVKFIRGKIFFFLLKIKWTKLYKSIGISKIETLETFNLIDIINSIYDAYAIFKKSEKLKINNLKYKKILIGDLLIDSFIRYRIEPTLDKKSFFFFYIIFKTIVSIKKTENLSKKYKINKYIGCDTVYISHGVPIRMFKEKGIETFSCGELFNYITKVDSIYSSNTNVLNYKKYFSLIKNKKLAIQKANKEIEKKFKGVEDQFGKSVSKNPFLYKKRYNYPDLMKIKGVVFLHDFYDAPHYYGSMIFNDHYEWTNHILNFIKKNNLSIGVKIHPNAVFDSNKIYELFKKIYPNIVWIKKDISNGYLLKLPNIKFAISNYGSVLYEMAYLDKDAVSAGQNRTSSFKCTYNPKNRLEYEKIILKLHNNTKKYSKASKKNEASKVYFTSFLREVEDIKTDIKKINLNKIRILYNRYLHNKKIDLSKYLVSYNRIINKN